MTTVAVWTPSDQQGLEEMQRLCSEIQLPPTEPQILVNIDTQRLHLVKSQKCVHSYLVSTALNGVGQKEGTGQTPLGLHLVAQKIGDGAHPLEVFSARQPIGIRAEENVGTKGLIVGRILRLQGIQPGFNQGRNAEKEVVDSFDRYIYIHGTNHVAKIGKPVSEGCVRMRPDDVIDLFGKVSEKTPVYIYEA